MRKDNSNWVFFLERLLAAVILTYLLMTYQQQQAFPKTHKLSLSPNQNKLLECRNNANSCKAVELLTNH